MKERIQNQARTEYEIEEIVKLIHLHLYNRGVCCGAKVIQRHMKELYIKPIPSVTTVGKILARHGLTHGRTGIYPEDFICETKTKVRPGVTIYSNNKKRLDIHQNKE